MNYEILKARLDFIGASALLVLLSPLLLLLTLLICIDSPGLAIYRQKRVGQCGRLFTIYKFRTMRLGTPTLSTEEMQLQRAKPFTRLGPLLRKTNLDELPQLLNIWRGDMSFIGPRPALPSQTDVNALREKMGVDSVRPGITGLAQVRGRDDLDTVTKVTYDSEYCRGLSLISDLHILLLTLSTIITARGNK